MKSFNVELTHYPNIFVLLEHHRITQARFADAIGVPKQRISHWKTGHKNPSLPLLIKTADFFGTSVDFLLGRSETATSPKSSSDMSKSEFARTLDEIIQQAEEFATEAVERYGSTNQSEAAYASLKAGLAALIEKLTGELKL